MRWLPVMLVAASWLGGPPVARAEAPAPGTSPSGAVPRGPHITVSPLDFEDGLGSIAMVCPFSVETLGFPAVSEGGREIVSVRTERPAGSEGSEDVMVVRWLDASTESVTRTEVVFEATALGAGEELESCTRLHREVSARVEKLEAMLLAGGFRSMARLDVHLPELEEEDVLAIPAARRPVELLWRNGEVIARVRRVKLFAREDAPWYGDHAEPDPDEPWLHELCFSEPHVREVFGDRSTGLLAVAYDNEPDACTCTYDDEIGIVSVPDALFETIDRVARLEELHRIEVELGPTVP